MTSPRVSIIIRCYNEADHIGKLLHGISEQSVSDYEIVLVDSGSTDGTLEIARAFGVDKIEYIEPSNFSFGRALNYGCTAAEGEYCVIASAHVYPKKDNWIETLIGKLDDEVALTYGKQRGNDVTTFSENQIFRQWFPEYDIETQDHPFCNNANAAVRRSVWEDFEYDEELPGLEDVDWAKRVQDAGYEISYVSEAEVVHVHDETAREIVNRYKREAIAHGEIFPNQSFSFTDFVGLSLKNIASDYWAAINERSFWQHALEIPKFRILQFWGTYRGFQKEGDISDTVWQRFYYPDKNTASSPTDADEGRAQNTIEYPDESGLATVQSIRSQHE